MRREHNKLSNSNGELLIHYTCDNTTKEEVSGIVFSYEIANDKGYYSDPIFVQDPLNPGHYAIKKKSGQYYLSPNLFELTNTISRFYLRNHDVDGLYNVRKNHTLISFDVYVYDSYTDRVIFNDGDIGTSGNGYNGACLFVYNSNICVRYCNNGTTITNKKIADLSDVKNKWCHVEVEYIPQDNDNCNISFSIDNGTLTYTYTVTISHPTSSNARAILLASSHWSYYRGMQDIVDYFKEIKVKSYEERI